MGLLIGCHSLQNRGAKILTPMRRVLESMTVDIDNESCIECGACADLCPEIFEMDERTGKARVIVFETERTDCIDEAISLCPAECITWLE